LPEQYDKFKESNTMNVQNQWKRFVIGGAAALALTAGTLWTVDTVSAASAGTTWSAAISEQIMELGGRGGRGGHDGALFGDQEQYLADALGITVDELQSAHETVRNTLIDQAVADGTVTQEQADQIKAGERVRVPGFRMKGEAGIDGAADHNALLADALGMTLEEVDAARVSAHDAAIAAALADGTITQEQVDKMSAHQALQEYLRTQYAEERPTATMEELIQEALGAGVLTQEQADLLLSSPGKMGNGGRGGFRGGFRDGDEGGRGPNMRGSRAQDEATPSDTQPNSNNSAPDISTNSNA